MAFDSSLLVHTFIVFKFGIMTLCNASVSPWYHVVDLYCQFFSTMILNYRKCVGVKRNEFFFLVYVFHKVKRWHRSNRTPKGMINKNRKQSLFDEIIDQNRWPTPSAVFKRPLIHNKTKLHLEYAINARQQNRITTFKPSFLTIRSTKNQLLPQNNNIYRCSFSKVDTTLNKNKYYWFV